MISASLRLRHRAAVLDGQLDVRPSPADELALAKSRLQVSGFMLEERVDRIWLPFKDGLEQRPVLTLAGVAFFGAASGWLDDRTGNGVQRLFLRWIPRLMPWMIRSILSRRVPHER